MQSFTPEELTASDKKAKSTLATSLEADAEIRLLQVWLLKCLSLRWGAGCSTAARGGLPDSSRKTLGWPVLHGSFFPEAQEKGFREQLLHQDMLWPLWSASSELKRGKATQSGLIEGVCQFGMCPEARHEACKAVEEKQEANERFQQELIAPFA